MVTVKNVLKAVLKVGLKAAVPFVGDILVAAVEEGVGLLIDHQSEQKARDLHGRLLKQMQNHANALARGKGISLERLDYIVPTVEVILSHHNLRQGEWSNVNFDAERATITVLDRAETTLRSLNKEDNALCGLLIEAFYTALLKDHDALIDLEAAMQISRLMPSSSSCSTRVTQFASNEGIDRLKSASIPRLSGNLIYTVVVWTRN